MTRFTGGFTLHTYAYNWTFTRPSIKTGLVIMGIQTHHKIWGDSLPDIDYFPWFWPRYQISLILMGIPTHDRRNSCTLGRSKRSKISWWFILLCCLQYQMNRACMRSTYICPRQIINFGFHIGVVLFRWLDWFRRRDYWCGWICFNLSFLGPLPLTLLFEVLPTPFCPLD